MFEFIPVWNIPVWLSYTMRRVSCPDCGIKVEAVPWAQGKNSCCDVYRHFLASWARLLSWKQTAVCLFGVVFGVGPRFYKLFGVGPRFYKYCHYRVGSKKRDRS